MLQGFDRKVRERDESARYARCAMRAAKWCLDAVGEREREREREVRSEN